MIETKNQQKNNEKCAVGERKLEQILIMGSYVKYWLATFTFDISCASNNIEYMAKKGKKSA